MLITRLEPYRELLALRTRAKLHFGSGRNFRHRSIAAKAYTNHTRYPGNLALKGGYPGVIRNLQHHDSILLEPHIGLSGITHLTRNNKCCYNKHLRYTELYNHQSTTHR